jgi:ADP-sugar diphosphatase
MLQELDRQEIEDLKDKLTGEKSQGEMITLRVCDYEQLWQHGARDAKTLAAWALYEGLNRQGLIEAERLKTSKLRSDSPTEVEGDQARV